MVSTHLKHISQIGNLPQIGVNIKNCWNHHPYIYILASSKYQKKEPLDAVMEGLLGISGVYPSLTNTGKSGKVKISKRTPNSQVRTDSYMIGIVVSNLDAPKVFPCWHRHACLLCLSVYFQKMKTKNNSRDTQDSCDISVHCLVKSETHDGLFHCPKNHWTLW